jgi:hypothetical protein
MQFPMLGTQTVQRADNGMDFIHRYSHLLPAQGSNATVDP